MFKEVHWYFNNTAFNKLVYDEGAEHGEGDRDLKIAEFDKAAVLGIIRKFKE